jgi:hypothetical protein
MIHLVSGEEIINCTYVVLQLTLLVSCFLTQRTGFETSVYKHDTPFVRTGHYQLHLRRYTAHSVSYLVPNSADRVRDQC